MDRENPVFLLEVAGDKVVKEKEAFRVCGDKDMVVKIGNKGAINHRFGISFFRNFKSLNMLGFQIHSQARQFKNVFRFLLNFGYLSFLSRQKDGR